MASPREVHSRSATSSSPGRGWFTWFGRPKASDPKPETKAASGPVSGLAPSFAIVSGEGAAHWSGRSYAALSRTGLMKNPVAYRAMRMIAEAAAAVPWLAYEGTSEVPDHAALGVLARPMGGRGISSRRSTGICFFPAMPMWSRLSFTVSRGNCICCAPTG